MTIQIFDKFRGDNPGLFKPIVDSRAFEGLRHCLSVYQLKLTKNFELNADPHVTRWFARQSAYVFPISKFPEINLAAGRSEDPYNSDTFKSKPGWARKLFRCNKFQNMPHTREEWLGRGKPAGGWDGPNLSVVDIVLSDDRLVFEVAPDRNKWINVHLQLFNGLERGYGHSLVSKAFGEKYGTLAGAVKRSDWAARQLHVSTVMLFIDNEGDLAVALQRRGLDFNGGGTFHTGISSGGVEPLSSYDNPVDLVSHAAPTLTNSYLIKSYASENGEELGIKGSTITPVCMILENCLNEDFERPGYINVCSVLSPTAGGYFSEEDILSTMKNYFKRDDAAPEVTGLGVVKVKDLFSSMEVGLDEIEGHTEEVLILKGARVFEKGDTEDSIRILEDQRLTVKFSHAQILADIADPTSVLGARFRLGAGVPHEMWGFSDS